MRTSDAFVGLGLAALLLVGAGCVAAGGGRAPAVGPDGAAGGTEPALYAGENVPMVGADRDEHGCIGSAGYSWCEARQKCTRPWEEECFASSEEGVRYALAAKYGKPLADVIVRIDREYQGYARGSVKFGAGAPEGGMFLAAKQGNRWILAYDGNGGVDCGKIKQDFAFPDEVLKGFCDAR